MSDTVIKIENLGKKYIIGHELQRRGQYVTLRDVIANKAKRVFSFGRNGKPDPTREEFWALKDVSFEVKQGDRLGIIGRNGAGKSTLLKALSRIVEPTTGKISIKGRVASLLEVGTGFHPELRGRENIYLNGAILGMSKAEIKKKFDEIVAFSEIEKFLDTPVKRYSSGMYVRLAFAVAAHLEPDILVVDEVLAVGDAQFQKKCLGKMEDVATEGRTVLFVSHNMTAIVALCPRVLLITEGHITLDGAAQNVVQDYIGQYQAASSAESLRERRDRRGDGCIRMVDVGFGTPDNPERGFWITGQDAFIHLGYEGLPDQMYRNVEIAVGVSKLDQVPLLYLGTKVVRQDIDLVRGLQSSVCRIKRLPLEPGRYSITVEIQQNGIIVDHVQAAAIVDVAEGDYYGTGVMWPYGGFLCDYSWSHCPGKEVSSQG